MCSIRLNTVSPMTRSRAMVYIFLASSGSKVFSRMVFMSLVRWVRYVERPYSLVVIWCWGLVVVVVVVFGVVVWLVIGVVVVVGGGVIFLGLKPVGVIVPRYLPVTLTGFFLVLCHLDFSL